MSRKMYYANRIKYASSNTNATWKIIKEVMGTNTDPPPTDDMTLNGSKIDSSLHANSFNSLQPHERIFTTATDVHLNNGIHVHIVDHNSNHSWCKKIEEKDYCMYA